MLLSEPNRTPYDLNFNLFGFPVRVHPAFFIMPLLLGSSVLGIANQLGVNTGLALIILVAVFFVSILVHELGHTFAFRLFGIPSHIVLYWMGGLAIPGSGGVWSKPNYGRLTSNQQIVISLAGPVFGFLLAVAFAMTYMAVGGSIVFDFTYPLAFVQPVLIPDVNPALFLTIFIGLQVNVLWNILNLMPVYPLDGGQVARELFNQFDPRNGTVNSLYLGIAAGAGLALMGFATENTFMGFFFGYMAFTNYQMLQNYRGFGGGNPW